MSPLDPGGTQALPAAGPSAYRRLEHLYEIGKLLAEFEGIETTVPALLAIVAKSVPVRGAVLIERRGKRPRLFAWHPPRPDPERTRAARTRALSEYAYLAGGEASGAPPEVVEAPMELLREPVSAAPGQEPAQPIVLPLALHGEPIFGVFQIEGAAALDEESLAFVNAVTNQLAIALDRHNARLDEAALKADLERRILQRTEQLERKVSELNAFAHSIAHDLRAPLRAMSGFAQMLLKDHAPGLDAAGQDYARRIVSASQRMDALTRDLLAFGQVTLSEITLEPIAIAALLARVLEAMESELQERNARVELAPDLPAVIGHAASLAQVFANLLSNAAKFTAPGTQPRIRVRSERRDGRARLWIEDNGIGIPPEHHERIFQIFQRLNPRESFPGTGIGLAIARKAMERMGGRIGLESAPGAGSRFWIELATAPESR